MFTISQINEASKKVKSGADFPQFVQDLKVIGVSCYDTFVADGHTKYYGANNFILQSAAKYPVLPVNNVSSATTLKHVISIHQQGQTDYSIFCRQAAEAGVEKWRTDILAMTVTYFDKHGDKLTTEPIPFPS